MSTPTQRNWRFPRKEWTNSKYSVWGESGWTEKRTYLTRDMKKHTLAEKHREIPIRPWDRIHPPYKSDEEKAQRSKLYNSRSIALGQTCYYQRTVPPKSQIHLRNNCLSAKTKQQNHGIPYKKGKEEREGGRGWGDIKQYLGLFKFWS